jgi:UDP-N-acetylglucosamine:LPS N-acetylglucosamine transferase
MIPGQEEFNARLLQEEGAGVVAHNPEELHVLVTELLAAPERMERMRACARRLARPTAAAEITRLVQTL